MGLKHRLERIEEKLDPNRENMIVVIEVHYSPIEDPKAIPPGRHYVSPYYTACFLGGTEERQREALKRLRRDAQYQRDPCAGRPKLALEGGGATADLGRGAVVSQETA